MSIESSLLGQETNYPTQYQPDILFPVPRTPTREQYTHIPHIKNGVDWWHIFEISWLNSASIPQVAIGRLSIDASSTYIIESKSLKLYFNSLNFSCFSSQEELIQTVEKDLSQVALGTVSLTLINVHALPISQPIGQCIDHLTPTKLTNQPDSSLLKLAKNSAYANEHLYSDLLRSNCPVTNQPDWATVFIRYEGKQIDKASLLAYIISFREHNGFHEQCVEQIFADLWQKLQPEKLMVYAAYTRRGGLDINPYRSSHSEWLPTTPLRLARQ